MMFNETRQKKRLQSIRPATDAPKVMLIDEQTARAAILERALKDSGYQVVARMSDTLRLTEEVSRLQPDVIIIDIDSPDRDTLEHMNELNANNPHPVVMFAEQDAPQIIESAVQAGVSAYIVDGLQPQRVKAIVNVAIARFREYQALRQELEQTKVKLADRKYLDKAKGILMQQRGLTEEEAYKAMRKMAMDKGEKLVDIARNIIDVYDLLHAS
ncbi:putative transcriptional regulatory protein pdtaR [BD1-7 clade bacterium]|uniref:Putative transcriptional regulatory protein pdtaR n=1 Tax=BD1-7 clade bacterium TaxID=2029982 RepID=A0A5S9P757_9GAMM|nr:putative transcriptional regulatory protein pdtaR [BD1-7 clade bacterium]CAA0099290.1 putative transcriptional regulatory protein pdtaR [BD1-7 clade bacterium]